MGSRKKWTQEKIKEALDRRNIQCITNVDSVTQPSVTPIKFKCGECECEWNARIDNVVNKNSGCPNCAGNNKLTLDEVQKILDDRKEHITITGFTRGSTLSPRKGIFNCNICSNKWSNTLSNVTSKNQGCGICNKSLGILGKAWFSVDNKDARSYFYCIEFYNNDEHFIKVGITKQPILSRFGKRIYRKYKFDVLVLEQLDVEEAWIKEQTTLAEFSEFKHTPTGKYFAGKHECLSVDKKTKIIKFIEDYNIGNTK